MKIVIVHLVFGKEVSPDEEDAYHEYIKELLVDVEISSESRFLYIREYVHGFEKSFHLENFKL